VIPKDKRVVVDIDGVLARKDDGDYADKDVHQSVLDTLEAYDERGFYIILYTARNMNTHDARMGKINAETAPVLLDWLEEHDVPYDEIHYGKPWCGHDGFYVDDKAIRPSEFRSNDYDEIMALLAEEERRMQR
jgi:capsule biosynthesis phosphatase